MSKRKYYVGCLNQEYDEMFGNLVNADVYTYVDKVSEAFATYYPKDSKCTPAMLFANLYRAQQLGYEIVFLDAEQHKAMLKQSREEA